MADGIRHLKNKQRWKWNICFKYFLERAGGETNIVSQKEYKTQKKETAANKEKTKEGTVTSWSSNYPYLMSLESLLPYS
jgi:AMMECR1 domain-containing protein